MKRFRVEIDSSGEEFVIRFFVKDELKLKGETLLMDIDFTHPNYERLINVEKQIQSGARLTSHLLGYARKGKYEVKSLDLNQLVKDTSETFGRTKKEVKIHLELSKDLSAIKADPGR